MQERLHHGLTRFIIYLLKTSTCIYLHVSFLESGSMCIGGFKF